MKSSKLRPLLSAVCFAAAASIPIHTAQAAPVMLGAFVKGDSDAFQGLEKQIGRRLALDFQYKKWDWSDGMSRQRWDVQQGRTPLIAWSANYADGQSCATATAIAAGKYDSQLKAQAASVKSLGAKVLIEFLPEMTDRKDTMNCFYGANWSAADAGVTRSGAAYVAAEHHVVSIFRATGAANVQWVFAPEGQPYKNITSGVQEWTSFYPGSAWVDWIGVDHHLAPEKSKAFPDNFFLRFYRETVGYGKPLIVAQTAAVADPSANPDAQTLWLTTARTEIPRQFPALRAFVYNDNGKQDRGGAAGGFKLSGAGLAAFRDMANDPNFAGR